MRSNIEKILSVICVVFLVASCGDEAAPGGNRAPDQNPSAQKPDGGSDKADEPAAPVVVFKDKNFEECVKSQSVKVEGEFGRADFDNDGRLQVEEALRVESLSCPGAAIRSLDGIEQLKNLEYVNCSANDLGAMPEFSQLDNLKTLRCVNNYFSDADCDELSALRAMGLEELEIEQQRDGRILTCDQVTLVGRIKSQDKDKSKKIFEGLNSLNDVWGFAQEGRNYGIYGDVTHIHIVEMLDTEPYFKKTVSLERGSGSKGLFTHPNHSIWGEYRHFHKDGKYYVYASSEGNRNFEDTKDPPHVQIFDVTDLAEPKELFPKEYHEGFTSAHNLTLDQDRELLVLFGGGRTVDVDGKKKYKAWKGARLYSLEDPVNPRYITTVGKYYVHDGQIKTYMDMGKVQSTRLYLAEGSTAIHWDSNKSKNKDNRFGIYDLTKLNPKEFKEEQVVEILDQQYKHGYCHNIWVSDDDTHIIITGETSVDNQLSFWELVEKKDAPGTGKLEAEFRNGINLQGGSFAHNAYIVGNHVYLSHYTKGVQVAEIYTTDSGKKKIRLKWAYDTFPESNAGVFDGSWGIFPFSADPNVFFATDIANGFFIFRKSPSFLAEEQVK